jgi:nucleoid DNA-binding protein
LNRRDPASAISPGRTGTDKSKWDPDELSRPKAEQVVNATFDSIAAALKQGEKVTLPIGTFEVLRHTRPPMRRWLLGRVRVTYARRRYIQFTPAEGCLDEPAEVCLDEEPAGVGKVPAPVEWRAKYLERQKARKQLAAVMDGGLQAKQAPPLTTKP